MPPETIKEVDFAVVGCGVAGLRTAIELGLAGARVLVLAKSELTDSATEWAQGGIAAALSDEDEISLHEEDTLRAGDGLCNPAAVHVLVEEGPSRILELIEWGTEFDRAGSKLAFTREAAHSRSRVLHAHGDSTGKEIARALFAKARAIPGIRLQPYAVTTSLLQEVECGRVSGLRFLDETTQEVRAVRATAVALATGGLGQVYPETTNPPVATGDGMCIAYAAGAVLSDLEFVQFHPTALAVKGAPCFLLSEALRGEGAILRNVRSERFMKRYNDAGELAPRDVVSRAIVNEMQQTSADSVFLDLRHFKAKYVRERFPRIYSTCLSYGVDITGDLVPVRPAAHYAMGGVKTDVEGRCSLPGLYAAGETACTGVHGANRLASNSLLEGLVFGARAGKAMLADAQFAKARAAAGSNPHRAKEPAAAMVPSARDPGIAAMLENIQSIAWEDVGIIRSAAGLKDGLEKLAPEPPLDARPSRQALELHNIWTLTGLIARCALAREESRGGHYRTDFPQRKDMQFRKHSLITQGAEISFR